jgi:hypothetical protein
MLNQLTELEKHLYNKHLAVTKSNAGKPFRLKKDFSDVYNTDKHKFLKRISILFQKHPEISPETFFQAPYKLYPDVTYFGLDYFSSMRAVKAYTTYKKQIFLQNPDSQMDQIKDSLPFISKFCISNNILLHQYSTHRSSDLFSWMIHYKQNKINLYVMFEFSNIFSSMQTFTEDVQRFFVRDFLEQFKSLHSLYINSTQARPYLKKAFPILENFIQRELTTNKRTVS